MMIYCVKNFISSLHLPSNSRFFSIFTCSSVLHLHLARSSSCSCCLFTSSLRFFPALYLRFSPSSRCAFRCRILHSSVFPRRASSFSLPFCVPMRFFVDVFYFTDIRLLCYLASHAPPFPSFPLLLLHFSSSSILVRSITLK